jgi:hypothetical protein
MCALSNEKFSSRTSSASRAACHPKPIAISSSNRLSVPIVVTLHRGGKEKKKMQNKNCARPEKKPPRSRKEKKNVREVSEQKYNKPDKPL